MTAEQEVKASLSAASRYHAAFTIYNFVPITSKNIEDHEMLPFDTVPEVLAVVNSVLEDLRSMRTVETIEEKMVLDLQATLARSELYPQPPGAVASCSAT